MTKIDSNLDASAIVAALRAPNWPFITKLFQHSLPVAGLLLSPDQAALFFHNISPAAFIQDADGELLPANIRRERNQFAKANGRTASQKSADEAIFVSQWLTEFLMIQRGYT